MRYYLAALKYMQGACVVHEAFSRAFTMGTGTGTGDGDGDGDGDECACACAGGVEVHASLGMVPS